ncbi:unnamed protein product [Pleuronectes platessa]|uniref:Uncharacterized protein n=1 Tax=Pleuronectes platessa TaxID=8262 RepID=A0A9N7UAF6_PLEPL|nr:unnamed protein product [Pleuronectes platessa]
MVGWGGGGFQGQRLHSTKHNVEGNLAEVCFVCMCVVKFPFPVSPDRASRTTGSLVADVSLINVSLHTSLQRGKPKRFQRREAAPTREGGSFLEQPGLRLPRGPKAIRAAAQTHQNVQRPSGRLLRGQMVKHHVWPQLEPRPRVHTQDEDRQDHTLSLSSSSGDTPHLVVSSC